MTASADADRLVDPDKRRRTSADDGRNPRRQIVQRAQRMSRQVSVIGVVTVVILMSTACRSTKRSPTVTPTRGDVSSEVSPADLLLQSEAAEMAASDQKRASQAAQNAEPAVLYRDPPLRRTPFPR